jgi:L-threonylcarbamoyladenylate synthase
VLVAEGHAALLRAIAPAIADGRRVGVLCWSGHAPAGAGADVRLPGEPAGYAQGLYAALHLLDAQCEVIVIERPPDGSAWEAIRDRVRRASVASDAVREPVRAPSEGGT